MLPIQKIQTFNFPRHEILLAKPTPAINLTNVKLSVFFDIGLMSISYKLLNY